MELVLAILMGLGIFLVIPVIIGLSTIGIYLLNRRRMLNTERKTLMDDAVADAENTIEEIDVSRVPGPTVNEHSEKYVESK